MVVHPTSSAPILSSPPPPPRRSQMREGGGERESPSLSSGYLSSTPPPPLLSSLTASTSVHAFPLAEELQGGGGRDLSTALGGVKKKKVKVSFEEFREVIEAHPYLLYHFAFRVLH